jgi:hypothetical protein
MFSLFIGTPPPPPPQQVKIFHRLCLAEQILDLSDCQLDDEALIRIMPVFGHLEELFLSDNTFTWYGIR